MQFGIKSSSEWLLVARGKAKCNYAIHKCYNPKLYKKTCYCS